MVVHSDDKLRIALDGDLCVLRWFDSPGPEQFDTVLATTRRAGERGRLAILSVADGAGKVPRFGADELTAGRRMSEGFATVTKAVSHVILMDGFTGVSVRMFVATLVLLRRSGSPNKVFSTLDDGAAWLAPFVTTPGLSKGILDVYASLR